jgi:hypothetical protein
VGSRYAREDKKKGIFGYKRFLVPVNKVSFCSSFMSSSVLHKITVREEVVPVPLHLNSRTCRILLFQSIAIESGLLLPNMTSL